jgi:hypothetical protein
MHSGNRQSVGRCLFVLTILTAGACGYALLEDVFAQDAEEMEAWHKGLPRQYKSKWLVHDLRRPLPEMVTPGKSPGNPPADAVILFDGKDLSKWTGRKDKAEWKVENGYAEVNDTGSISTREAFGDCQLHIEWRAPSPPEKRDQARGNSGVLFMGRYEVQVLDSYNNRTYADGTAASVYGQHPPMVNACRPPGEWQTYDIVFRAPRFGEDKKIAEPARVTLFHNGVCVQHNAEVFGGVRWRGLATYTWHPSKLPLTLQDHGDKQPVRFRNIWLRHLDLTEESDESES